MTQEIKIQPEHLALIQNCYIRYEDCTEYGGFAQDPKRPYGNSSVLLDIREILEEGGFDADSYSDGQLHQFHEDLRNVLMISIQEQSWDIVGRTYESKYGFEWERVDTHNCSELSDWDKIEEVVEKAYQDHPNWRLTLEQIQDIFHLSEWQATEVIDRLEAEGFLVRQIHRRCKTCSSGIDFVLPENDDDDKMKLDCPVCDNEQPVKQFVVFTVREGSLT